MIFDLFKNSNKTLEEIHEYVQTRTDDPELFESNVIDEDNLDDWNIDDFLIALPKTIEYNDKIFALLFYYRIDLKQWSVGYYNSAIDQLIFGVYNIDKYEAFKELYNKLKTVDKLN